MSIELIEIVAKLSDMLTYWNPVFTKLDRAVNGTTFEVSHSTEPVNKDEFWKHCQYSNVSFSAAEKEKLFLRYHRAQNCFQNVQLLALALKRLCDMGLFITYCGFPIADIVVLSDEEIHLTDGPGTLLTFRSPGTAMTLHGMSTYANIDAFQREGLSAPRVYGSVTTEISKRCDEMRFGNPEKYTGTAPYWWIAVVTNEGLLLEDHIEKMIHLDISSAAFDDASFCRLGGKFVAMQMFETPAFEFFPAKHLPEYIKPSNCEDHFILRPYRAIAHGKGSRRFSFIVSDGAPQLSAYMRMGSEHVKLTSLETFVRKECPQSPRFGLWLKHIERLHTKVLTRIPARTPVAISKSGKVYSCYDRSSGCEAKSQATFGQRGANLTNSNLMVTLGSLLKQRSGMVHSSVTKDLPTHYIPVVLTGEKMPVWVKPSSIMLTLRRQYSTYAELLKKCTTICDPLTIRFSAKSLEMANSSTENQAALRRALNNSPLMKTAYTTIAFGKVNWMFFQDPNNVDGMRMILDPDFSSRFLSAEDIAKLKQYIVIADYPHAMRRWGWFQRMGELKGIIVAWEVASAQVGEATTDWLKKAVAVRQRAQRTRALQATALKRFIRETAREGNTNSMTKEQRGLQGAMDELSKLAEMARRDKDTVKFFQLLDDAGLALNPFKSHV